MNERFCRRIEDGFERLARRIRHARGPRPIWHHRADGVEAHVLVCFLAYVLWKTLEQWQRRAELGQSPRTILEELRQIQSTDVVFPLRTIASSACGAWCGPTRPRPRCSTGSVLNSPNV